MKNRLLIKSALLAGMVTLGATSINAAIVLYTTDFSGDSGTNLSGVAVDTSGATGAQHTLYGTTAGETWTANTYFKADGSTTGVGGGAALAFTPQDGYIYTLTMTVDFTAPSGSYYAAGYLDADGTGAIGAEGIIWGLTRPGLTTNDDQVAHYNAGGGLGNIGSGDLDTTIPSTIILELDTTNALDWVATWSFSTTAGGVTELVSQSVDGSNIEGVGLGNHLLSSGTFESFELSVAAVPEPSAALLGSLGILALFRRRR